MNGWVGGWMISLFGVRAFGIGAEKRRGGGKSCEERKRKRREGERDTMRMMTYLQCFCLQKQLAAEPSWPDCKRRSQQAKTAGRGLRRHSFIRLGASHSCTWGPTCGILRRSKNRTPPMHIHRFVAFRPLSPLEGAYLYCSPLLSTK